MLARRLSGEISKASTQKLDHQNGVKPQRGCNAREFQADNADRLNRGTIQDAIKLGAACARIYWATALFIT
jgi:hypothetical protein